MNLTDRLPITPDLIQASPPTPKWMQWVLWVAAVYNILFGAWVVILPNHYFELVGMALPNYPELWQCIGMIVGVYGLGYLIAGFSPLRHWPIVLVGFLGKIFGPLGFLKAIITGSLPLSFGWILLSNDLIWWWPFGAMLWATYQHYSYLRHKGL
jgi:small multidrug resistance pump